jgi:hypothetical protein
MSYLLNADGSFNIVLIFASFVAAAVFQAILEMAKG